MQRGTGGKGEKESPARQTGFEGEKRVKGPAGLEKKKIPSRPVVTTRRRLIGGSEGQKGIHGFEYRILLRTFRMRIP